MAGPLARLAALKREVDEKREQARKAAQGTKTVRIAPKDHPEGEESCSIMEDASENLSELTDNVNLYDASQERPAIIAMEDVVKGKLDFDLICSMIDPDLNEQTKLTKEEDLEEFIVLKIVRDVNMPRLSHADQLIFDNICMDMFSGTPTPKTFQEIKIDDMFKSKEKAR